MLKTTIWSTSPFGHRVDDRLGDDVQEDLVPGLRLGGDLRLACPIGRLTPTPGFMMLTATSPMTSASVVTISK